eukprot:jgi/Undpi1/12522/HiC_scaffold_6.g02191.m1
MQGSMVELCALVGASAKSWTRPLTGQTPLDPLDHRLRKDVKMLGGILGETIQKHSEILAVSKAFAHFFSLANAAELVLTAHPTEINRRTLLVKHQDVAKRLDHLEQIDRIGGAKVVRRIKPTPQDEARAGIAVIEQVLWDAVPAYLRRLDGVLSETVGKTLPIHASPVVFASWMGGDRDGNPNVTPAVTREVSFTARREAAALYMKEFAVLVVFLFVVLFFVSFICLCLCLCLCLCFSPPRQILEPLMMMYKSLVTSGQKALASGPLVDAIRRARCFGVCLAPLDIRQESTRHTEAMDAITRYLGVGSYAQWDEQTRQSWLLTELQGKRPLLPRNSSLADLGFDSIDTLGTFEMAASLGQEALGAYVISMATSPSDVLAVKLMQKEFGMPWKMRVVPLFETLDDLEKSEDTLRTLLTLPWYRGNIEGTQEVMIGYSDSAKDAGRMAAAWAQYNAQERLAAVAEESDVKLTFFHGKGGTVSRGGNPALYEAIMAQPRGTVNGHFRVTEQGEMITQNFGHPGIAINTLDIYTAGAYRGIVRKDPRFVPYFRTATPELELGALNIGSRPAKRRPTGGVESLRAIPWVFSWTQTRLNLPAWLGVGDALAEVASTAEGKADLRGMYEDWPFFATNIGKLHHCLYGSSHYDSELVAEGEAKELGSELRRRLKETAGEILNVSENNELISSNKLLRWQLALRNPYLDPVNIMQAHILHRLRNGKFGGSEEENQLQDALVITVKGIAGGMRNTG